MKRVWDVAVAFAALALLWPLLVVIALAVRLDSAGPVFYRQERVGRGGRRFAILKFRSMVVHADQIGPYHTARGDARITRVGGFLRKTSLDELPQLLNVLRGDMSLVGPRPDVPAQEILYAPADWAKRCSVRPGLTGLAQATLRSAATPEERRRLDLEYVDRASLGFDLKILFLTVRQVLGRGSF
jgi:lipopolysaccharide/colanic/teichoic acid biosynthesis glycosyltransferase